MDDGFLTYDKIKIPLTVYVFPDGTTQGNLEDLFMRAAQISYPNELQLSLEYNDAVKEFQKTLRSDSAYKKSVIGCIANTMRPGKANQVSIGQDEWVTEKTVKDVKGFHRLYKIITDVCEEL